MNTLYDTAMSYIGTPYKWGGPENGEGDYFGVDCSGLVQLILSSVPGMDPPGDQTAQALFDHYSKSRSDWDVLDLGSLAFYGIPESISHVGFCIDDTRMIEAGGGSSSIHTLEDAVRANAFVKVSPIYKREDFYCALLPHYDL